MHITCCGALRHMRGGSTDRILIDSKRQCGATRLTSPAAGSQPHIGHCKISTTEAVCSRRTAPPPVPAGPTHARPCIIPDHPSAHPASPPPNHLQTGCGSRIPQAHRIPDPLCTPVPTPAAPPTSRRPQHVFVTAWVSPLTFRLYESAASAPAPLYV